METDPGEVERHEDALDHLGDDRSGVLGEGAVISGHQSCDQKSEDGMDPEKRGNHARGEADADDDGEGCRGIGKAARIEFVQKSRQTRATGRCGDGGEDDDRDHAHDGGSGVVSGPTQAQDHREYGPSQEVVDRHRGDQQQTEVGFGDAQIEKQPRDDSDGGDRHGRTDQQGKGGRRNRGFGPDGEAEPRDPGPEGQRDEYTRRRDGEGLPAQAPRRDYIDFESDDQKEEKDADLGAGLEEGSLDGFVGEEGGEGLGREVSEHRVAQKDPGEYLAGKRWLAESSGAFPEHARRREDEEELGEEEEELGFVHSRRSICASGRRGRGDRSECEEHRQTAGQGSISEQMEGLRRGGMRAGTGEIGMQSDGRESHGSKEDAGCGAHGSACGQQESPEDLGGESRCEEVLGQRCLAPCVEQCIVVPCAPPCPGHERRAEQCAPEDEGAYVDPIRGGGGCEDDEKATHEVELDDQCSDVVDRMALQRVLADPARREVGVEQKRQKSGDCEQGKDAEAGRSSPGNEATANDVGKGEWNDEETGSPGVSEVGRAYLPRLEPPDSDSEEAETDQNSPEAQHPIHLRSGRTTGLPVVRGVDSRKPIGS